RRKSERAEIQLIEVERQHAQARDRRETNDPTDDDTVERGKRRIESRPPPFHGAMLLHHQRRTKAAQPDDNNRGRLSVSAPWAARTAAGPSRTRSRDSHRGRPS